MKRIILTVALAVATVGISKAQEIKFGAKAGVNFASVGGDETDDANGRTSFHVGGLAEIMLSDKFSIQPELLYSSQGATTEVSESDFGIDITGESTLKLDYINVPVLAKYYITENLSIEAGPQVGFLLSAKEEYESTVSFGGMSETESGEEDVKEFVSTVDFAVGAGIGYKMENGLNFAARYNLGLSNIADTENGDEFSRQNNVIQVSVGYIFN